jgi:ribose 5-phosphate isomerase A
MKWTSLAASELHWSGPITNQAAKQEVAARIARRVRNGDVIGVGSGSTVFLAIQAIGARIKAEGLTCLAIAGSPETSMACAAVGIPTTSLLCARPDWSFDGADEVDPAHNLIKGRGGAMFREKLLMSTSPKNFIIIDRSKLVSRIGEKFPVPVEVFPEAVHWVEGELNRLGATQVKLRVGSGKDGPVITEAGNFILDAKFAEIQAPLEKQIKEIPGVIESGLFMGWPVEVWVSEE